MRSDTLQSLCHQSTASAQSGQVSVHAELEQGVCGARVPVLDQPDEPPGGWGSGQHGQGAGRGAPEPAGPPQHTPPHPAAAAPHAGTPTHCLSDCLSPACLVTCTLPLFLVVPAHLQKKDVTSSVVVAKRHWYRQLSTVTAGPSRDWWLRRCADSIFGM